MSLRLRFKLTRRDHPYRSRDADPFKSEWRRRSYYDPDVVFVEDDTYPLTARTWRRVSATHRTVRQGWRGFTYQASVNAVGTLVAVAVVYLVSLAGGLVTGVPVAVGASLAAVLLALTAGVYRLAPKQLLRARATELLDAEPARIVDSLRKIFTSPKSAFFLALDDDEEADWKILDALWDLPERERTILAVRFGGPMTLADIGDSLGLSRERVRQLEGRAIAAVKESVEADQSRMSDSTPPGDDGAE